MKNEPPFPFPTLVDSTMMSTFDACEMHFSYEYGRQMARLAISPDLHAGGAFAHGLAIVRAGLYKYKLTFEDAFTAGVRGMFEFWGDFDPPDLHPKSLGNMIGALENYFQEYPVGEELYLPLILNDGTPAVEFTIAVPTEVPHPQTGDPIIYAGRFDMLGVYDDSFLCVVDEKTAKSLPGDWATQWGVKGQMLGYCFGAQSYGYAVSTVVIRGIAILQTMYKHLQVVEEIPQWQIDRWWEVTNKKIRRMVQAWEQDDWMLSYGDGCNSFFRNCSFMELCLSRNPENSFLNYQKRVWNPLEKDPTWPKGGPQYETVGNISELVG